MGEMAAFKFPIEAETLAATMVQVLVHQAKANEVALLVHGDLLLTYLDHDNWDGGIDFWCLNVKVPPHVFVQLSADEKKRCSDSLREVAADILSGERDVIREVLISPKTATNANWRPEAKAWLSGEGITNQGRVRSANIAPRQIDGLLFRSLPEENLYRAFKTSGVLFAPLPVFLHGGKTYERLEPDFIVFREGSVMLVEVDGATIHRESPAEADQRTRAFKIDGALIERVVAADCETPDKASACAKRLLENFAKWKRSATR